MTTPANLAEWERHAEAVMDPGAWGYVTGGAGDEVTVAENRAAFAALRLRPRMLRGAGAASTTTTVLGTEIAAPVLVAPMAYQGCIHPDGDLNTAAAAATAGLGMCLSSLSNHDLADVAIAGKDGVRWYQLYPYRDTGMTGEVIARAHEHGYRALIVTVDVPAYGFRERDLVNGFAIPPHLRLPSVPVPDGSAAITPGEVTALMKLDLGWDDIERFVATAGLPVVVKGLLHPDDAVRAIEAGVSGVIVSNHGGRQLDTALPTIEALPEIAARVAGRCEIYLDSGVRRGTDVIKAVALGAQAVLIGRPIAWANGAAGREGIAAALAQILAEIENAMILAGCANIGEIGPDLVRAAYRA